MAHPEQRDFFHRLQLWRKHDFEQADRVLEVGSQDINGSIRPMFPQASHYLGIDLGDADGVDWVVPGELIELPDGWADVVVSTECFEHCQRWDQVLRNMLRICRNGGLLILTCASAGRATHGTLDSEDWCSPFTQEYYRNLSFENLNQKVPFDDWFDHFGFEHNNACSDLYAWGIRNAHRFNQSDENWPTMEERFARAQGQLAQAASRHAMITQENKNLKEQLQDMKEKQEILNAELNKAQQICLLSEQEIQRLNQRLVEQQKKHTPPWKRLWHKA